jgi:putative ABC transport system permease protein
LEYPLVLKALQRHKITVAILLLQFAVTFALLSNATVLIWQRFQTLTIPSGVEEKRLLIAKADFKNSQGFSDNAAQITTTQAELAAIKGVHSISVMSQTPFSGNGSSSMSRVTSRSDRGEQQVDIASYYFGYSALDTLRFRLIAGRWFERDEIAHPTSSPEPDQLHLAVITHQLAEELFPNENAVGKTVYGRNRPVTIIGVVEHFARPNMLGKSIDNTAIFPVEPPSMLQNEIAIRIEDNASESTIESLVRPVLDSSSTSNVSWSLRTFKDQRAEMFAQDHAAMHILLFILVALVVVSINAIAGLSYYWVSQRSHHVATRRALGAMRSQVIAYFLFENVCLCAAGVVLGCVLTLGLNTWLMVHFGAARIPFLPLIIGFLVAAVIGQVAVAYPAWKMGSVSPAVAAKV